MRRRGDRGERGDHGRGLQPAAVAGGRQADGERYSRADDGAVRHRSGGQDDHHQQVLDVLVCLLDMLV